MVLAKRNQNIALIIITTLIWLLSMPSCGQGQSPLEHFELVEDQSSYFRVMQDSLQYSQHSTLHKAIQSAFELAQMSQDAEITITREQLIKVDYAIAQVPQTTLLSDVEWTYSAWDSLQTYQLITTASSTADSIKFAYYNPDTLSVSMQQPVSGVVTDTLDTDRSGIIQVEIRAYGQGQWVDHDYRFDVDLISDL